jgi:acylphosphatase
LTEKIEQMCLYARIHGIVQGVGFRYSTIMRAKRCGLTGYARNMFDGTVEVVAEGQKADLESLLSWLQQGPSSAVVDRVEHRFMPYSGSYAEFGVEY